MGGYSFYRSELGGWGRDRWEDVLQGQVSKALPHRPGDYMTKSQGLRCFLGLDSSPDKNSMDQQSLQTIIKSEYPGLKTPWVRKTIPEMKIWKKEPGN